MNQKVTNITHLLAPSIRNSIDQRVEIASTMPDISSSKCAVRQSVSSCVIERLVRFVAYSGVPVGVTWLARQCNQDMAILVEEDMGLPS